MGPTLCGTLISCAVRTFERLAEGHGAGSPAGEAAFTSFNLQDIRIAHSDRVRIVQFNAAAEALNGADWEWWFHLDGNGFGMRVQAKREDRKGAYPFRHRVRDRLQNDLLIEDAIATGCLPMYVLYNWRNWLPPDATDLPGACDHEVADQRRFGCSVVSALTVRYAIEESGRPNVFARERSRPWNEVFCDTTTAGANRLAAVHARVVWTHRLGDAMFGLRQTHDVRPALRPDFDREVRRLAIRQEPLPAEPEAQALFPVPGEQITAPYTRLYAAADVPPLDGQSRRRLAEIMRRPADGRLPARIAGLLRARDGGSLEPHDPRVGGVVLIDVA